MKWEREEKGRQKAWWNTGGGRVLFMSPSVTEEMSHRSHSTKAFFD